MTEIHVDFREESLLEELRKHECCIPIISKNLEVGDIQIIHTTNNLCLTFERKTTADLAASIKDGRYKEQKCRLLSTFPARHITYIIENGYVLPGKDMHGLSAATIEGAYVNTMYRDGIHVVFTKHVSDTAQWVLAVAKRCVADPDKYIVATTSVEYHQQCKVKTRKIDNITPSTCYLMQLCQIPGVSKKIAECIQQTYPTLMHLIRALTVSSNPEAELAKLNMIGAKKAKVITTYILQT